MEQIIDFIDLTRDSPELSNRLKKSKRKRKNENLSENIKEVRLDGNENKSIIENGSTPLCPICYNSFNSTFTQNNDIISIKCGHIFCQPCFSKLTEKKCPVCRKKFTVFYPLYFNF